LLYKYGLQLEMAAGSYCLAMFTVGDDFEAYERMEKALIEIDHTLSERIPRGKTVPEPLLSEHISAGYPLAKAWDMPIEEVELSEAVGKCVGEFINLYPPGIPLLVPGEIFTNEVYQKIKEYINMQLQVQGIRQQGKEWLLKVLVWGK
ncbi:MAG: hypothetical protein K6G30_00435, partial [Acetatifactor sp.]|nr:hypothetical protein [Acetatifactor sp.]